MYVVNRILGNRNEDESLARELQRREKLGEVEQVQLPFHDAGRRRLRVTGSSGTPIGVDLDNDAALKDGDVLAADEDESTLVVINIAPSEAMALRLKEELRNQDSFAFGVKLGHMLGNQHWPIKIEDDVVYAPVSIDRVVMETVIRTHGFEGVEWDFVPVDPGEVPTGMPDIHHEHQ